MKRKKELSIFLIGIFLMFSNNSFSHQALRFIFSPLIPSQDYDASLLLSTCIMFILSCSTLIGFLIVLTYITRGFRASRQK